MATTIQIEYNNNCRICSNTRWVKFYIKAHSLRPDMVWAGSVLFWVYCCVLYGKLYYWMDGFARRSVACFVSLFHSGCCVELYLYMHRYTYRPDGIVFDFVVRDNRTLWKTWDHVPILADGPATPNHNIHASPALPRMGPWSNKLMYYYL